GRDERIEAAPNRTGLLERADARTLVRDVDLDRDAALARGRARAGEIAVEARDPPAERQQTLRRGGPDAARRARDGGTQTLSITRCARIYRGHGDRRPPFS